MITARMTRSLLTAKLFLLAAGTGAGFAAPVYAQDEAYPPGVTKEIHQGVQRGLEWLARNQANEGSWRNSGRLWQLSGSDDGTGGHGIHRRWLDADSRSLLQPGATLG